MNQYLREILEILYLVEQSNKVFEPPIYLDEQELKFILSSKYPTKISPRSKTEKEYFTVKKIVINLLKQSISKEIEKLAWKKIDNKVDPDKRDSLRRFLTRFPFQGVL